MYLLLVLTFYQFQTSFQTPITFHLKDKRQFNDLEVDKIIWRSKRIFIRLRTINSNWIKILAPTTPWGHQVSDPAQVLSRAHPSSDRALALRQQFKEYSPPARWLTAVAVVTTLLPTSAVTSSYIWLPWKHSEKSEADVPLCHINIFLR